MSDIDYSKYSYRDYKRARNGIRTKRGRVRYNFLNFDEYQKNVETAVNNDERVNESEFLDNDNIDIYKEDNNDDSDNEEEHIDNGYQIKDLRTKKFRRAKENMDSKKRKDFIAALVVVMCFALTIVSADIVSGGGLFDSIAAAFYSVKGVPVYYAVELNSYADVDSARQASDLFRNSGAGGYVINDGTYRVIASVYPKKEDAEIVISRMISEGKAATVYEIKGAAVKYDKFGAIGEDLQSAVEFSGGLYDKLYEISNNLYKNEIAENQAKIELQMLYMETVSSRDTLITKTMDYSTDETVLMIRSELSACTAIIENLLDEKISRPSLLADIRYSYTMIVCSYCRLLRTLS